MEQNAETIRTNVAAILQAAGVKFTVALQGERIKDKDWKCDAWRVRFDSGSQSYETDYFTGTGHRKPIKGAPSDKGMPRTLYRERWEQQYLRPVAPAAADVLHSLTMDASAGVESFRDWCANFGYSDNSIDALNIYRACCDTDTQLRRIFTPDTLRAIREAVEGL